MLVVHAHTHKINCFSSAVQNFGNWVIWTNSYQYLLWVPDAIIGGAMGNLLDTIFSCKVGSMRENKHEINHCK